MFVKQSKWIKAAKKKATTKLLLEALGRVLVMKLSVLLACILILKVKCVRTTVISNVNFMFEVFSPKSMIRFFEFNDMGWNISQDCVKNMYSYLDALQKDYRWAYKCELKWRIFCEQNRKCRK